MSVDTAVYGTQRCPLTQGIREWLGEHRVPYDFYDIENDAEAEERVRRMNDGQLKYPMVTVGDRVKASLMASAFGFFLPVLLGNTLGGALLVGILNYSQTRDVRYPDRDCSTLELSWQEWLFGNQKGQPQMRSPNSGD